jgi:hypothetical protein
MANMTAPVRLLVAALRGGKYTQCYGSHIREGSSFCVLGVACDIYQKSHPYEKWEATPYGYYRFMGHQENMSLAVRDWFGFRDTFGHFGSGYRQCLANQNDDGVSFRELADLIEQRIDDL